MSIIQIRSISLSMLRQELEKITNIPDVIQHPRLLNELMTSYPHTIRILESHYKIDRYTCLMHVFEFTEKPGYIAIATFGDESIYAKPEFAHWLIDKGVLIEIPKDEACKDDIVFYFDKDGFKHAGLLNEDGRVVSKWGKGHLYEHKLLEVPEFYGYDIRFFKRLSYDLAIENLKLFAKENGMIFECADP